MIYESYWLLTGAALVIAAGVAFARTRDAIHPAVILSPTFFYMYCLWPLLLNRNGGLEAYFAPEFLEHTALIFGLSIIFMCFGLLGGSRQAFGLGSRQWSVFDTQISPRQSGRLFWLAIVLGILSEAVYWHMIGNAGGFANAYSRAKGGGWTTSGYIGETMLLSFPALLILAFAVRARRRVLAKDIAAAFFIAMPQLLQGTFGGRRGPLFIILATLFFSWFIARGRRPSLVKSIAVVTAIGCLVIVLASQRHYVFLGSEGHFDSSRIWETIAPTNIEQGNTYLAAITTVVTADYFDNFYWGYRYFVTYFIRPIPKQIWPSKYEDMDAEWLDGYGRENKDVQYEQAAGVGLPPIGTATGSIADGYQEFSWGVLVMFYLLGRSFAVVWQKHLQEGGFWSILYYLMLILSIYLPTQSFSAWLHRLFYMTVLAFLFWRFFIGRQLLSNSARGST